jgi:ABC-type branched-subunit amino acid transport system permease subunit
MAQIGVDEWVAQAEQRQSAPRGPLGSAQRTLERMPFVARLALVAAAAATLPLWTNSDYTLRIGVNALLLVLLALGLNTVVGWAGLLDLGYIAFYGFGAYSYALLSSEQIGVHLATLPAVGIVVIASALLGLLLGLPSRRLLGDYLAIVTLFFGQVFVELVLNADRVTLPGRDSPISLTGGSNGIPGVDAFRIFGWNLDQTVDYYLLLVLVVALVALLLEMLNQSRTGRAWRAVREDPLAAETMSVPVNSVKLAAFAIGAAIAGLAGSIFAAVQIGVFPANFETQILILIYAAVILGGAGSVWGAIAGGLVIGISLELLRDPDQASVLFYAFIAVTLLATIRPWRRLAVVAAATVALGLVTHAIAGAVDSSLVAGVPRLHGWLGDVLDASLILPDGDTRTIGNILFVVLVVLGIATAQLSPRLRTAVIPVLLVLGAVVWELRLVGEPSITRQLLLGALLVVLMNARPHGLLGQRRVEVV